MNEVSKVSQFVVDFFKQSPLVNTIAFEKTTEMDYNKENLYPLVNIDLVRSNVQPNLISFHYIISIVEARDLTPELNNEKIFGSNLIDNLNECHLVAVKFINYLRMQDNEDAIELELVSDIEMLKLLNGALDGVRLEIDITIPNEISTCE